jgi:hypothetical protein
MSHLGLEALRGQYCWGAHYEDLLNLSMSFGPPKLVVTAVPRESKSCLAGQRVADARGKWWLWVYLAYWRVLRAGRKSANSSSPMRTKQRAIQFLEGQKLTDIRVDVRTGATSFIFDLGGALEVRRREPGSPKEVWLLYEPSGYVLSVRGDGTYDHKPASGTDGRRGIARRALTSLL